MNKITISKSDFEREPLAAPFGFKGGYLSELWQATVCLGNEAGQSGTGLGTQSVLWSDADVFTSYPEAVGNSMMYLTTAFAAEQVKNVDWKTPIDLLDTVLPAVYERAKEITLNPQLRLTFALNAMVAIDNAAWQLYCCEKEISSFDDMLSSDFKPALSEHQNQLACIPLMSYNVPIDKIIETVDEGYFFLKIKIGADPDGDGDQTKMVEWDKQRLTEIHEAVKDRETTYTESGRIPYYLDANGRYDSKERLMNFLNHAEKIGALDRIILLEEPFPEEMKIDVSDIPVRLAADESAHSDKDAIERIELGYGAIALKPIAKTMSMSLKIAKVAAERDVPCFCADLTVNPILVDWNKNFAARLPSLPGMKIGVLESNGHQNYKNWEAMKLSHPFHGASWIEPQYGVFIIDESFYKYSGGILNMSCRQSDCSSKLNSTGCPN